MQTKTSLRTGVALGILLAFGAGAAAQAKPHKKHAAPAPAAAAQPDPETTERLNALANQIESLTSRLDQAQLQVQAAQAKADAAQADAQAARTQLAEKIETLPGVVKSAVVANTPKPGWWGETKVGGVVFADLSYIHQKTDGALPATATTAASNGYPSSNGTGFDIKRAYLSVDHKFNDIYSANITTDFNYDTTTKATQLFIKKAYLQAKFSDALVIRAGDVELPWVPFVESLEGYRFVENTLIDRIKYGTTTDTGLNVNGVLPYKPVTIGYSFSVIDGSGFKAPGDGNFNRSKQMDFEGRVNATVGPVTAAIGGYSGDLGKNINGVTINHTANRFDGLLVYSQPRFRIGGEYVYVKDFTGVTTATPLKDHGDGYSAFGSFSLTPKIALFGRYDWVNPERDATVASNKVNSAKSDEYFNLGVDYTPVSGVDIAMVYKRESVTNGLFNTTNGAAAPTSLTPYLASVGATKLSYLSTPNGSPAGSGIIGGLGGQNGTYDEFGIFMQYKF